MSMAMRMADEGPGLSSSAMPKPSPAPLPDDPGDYGPSGRSAWMDVDWRTHQRVVEVDGRWANVIELAAGTGAAGTGAEDSGRAGAQRSRSGAPAMVFIHGLSGSWQNWLENLPHFAAAGHRVIA